MSAYRHIDAVILIDDEHLSIGHPPAANIEEPSAHTLTMPQYDLIERPPAQVSRTPKKTYDWRRHELLPHQELFDMPQGFMH